MNALKPYGFSIVDTFGSMMMMDLQRIYRMCENNLEKDIVLGLHLHENMLMAFSLAQRFLEIKLPARNCVIDASLYGMGRVPGNLCMELLMDYLNHIYGGDYILDSTLEAIENYIIPIKRKFPWGYSTEFFLSAKYNLHRNYAEYFQKKGRLTTKDINNLLAMIPSEHKTVFDKDFAERMYIRYQNRTIDDTINFLILQKTFKDKCILAIAPGKRLARSKKEIEKYIHQKRPIIVTNNFFYEEVETDYSFFSNSKRFFEYKNHYNKSKIIITSNIIMEQKQGYVINYERLAYDEGRYFDNSGIMMLRFLKQCDVKEIALVGFDGFSSIGNNYMDEYFGDFVTGMPESNERIAEEIRRLQKEIKIIFLSKSLYDTCEQS